MMRRDRTVLTAAILAVAGAAFAGGAGAAPGGEAAAHRILKQMSDYLASAGELTFHADETYDQKTNREPFREASRDRRRRPADGRRPGRSPRGGRAALR